MQGVPALGFYRVSLKVELFQHCGVNTCKKYICHHCFNQKHDDALPWLMDLISIVLGMRSSAVPMTDFRLTLDLKRVFMSVDLPRPL